MIYFTSHKIIKASDGYVVELFLDEQLNEFSLEFLDFKKRGEKRQENKNLDIAVESYIREKLPDLKVKTVKIMLGSLLIASIPFLSADPSIMTVGAQSEVSANYNESDDLNYSMEEDSIKQADDIQDIGKASEEPVEPIKSVEPGRPTEPGKPPEPAKPVEPTKPIQINNELPYGIFNLGSQGEDVKKIQNALIKIGYSLNADGYYGAGTKNAILDFQKQYDDLVDDGIYGPDMRGYLKNATVNGPFIVKNPSDILALVNKTNRLPTDYVPAYLVVPNVPFTNEGYDANKQMRQVAALSLEQMFTKAKASNIILYGLSGYRSYDLQKSIFASNIIKYGSVEKANQWSAKAGQSEHQTGLVMDITSASAGYGLTQAFGETKEGKWVKENAHYFGFIIHYQKGKESITGYQYEPWHLRYVGKEAAQKIVSMNITFEEYLGNK